MGGEQIQIQIMPVLNLGEGLWLAPNCWLEITIIPQKSVGGGLAEKEYVRLSLVSGRVIDLTPGQSKIFLEQVMMLRKPLVERVGASAIH